MTDREVYELASSYISEHNKAHNTGLEIATNTVANATNFFS